VKPCSPVNRCQRFGGTCCMHFQRCKLFHSEYGGSWFLRNVYNLQQLHRVTSQESSPSTVLRATQLLRNSQPSYEPRRSVTVFTKAKFLSAGCHNANFRETYVRENAKHLNVTADGRRVSVVFEYT
jgi:hypothetical protein